MSGSTRHLDIEPHFSTGTLCQSAQNVAVTGRHCRKLHPNHRSELASLAPSGHVTGMVIPVDHTRDPAQLGANGLARLNERSREIFRLIVDGYLAHGEAVGSRHLARLLPTPLSPASVRNVMQDLEEIGLIYAPHTSSGRLPTELGLRFFVDALLELGDVSQGEREQIEAQVKAASQEQTLEALLGDAMMMLSGLTRGAGVVVTTKDNALLKHVEFVRIEPERALAVLVAEDGSIENRIVQIPAGLPPSALCEAGNYLNARIRGRTLLEVRAEIEASRKLAETELDELTARLVDAGLAGWAESAGHASQLIVRGQANLLQDLTALEDLERIRLLFADLETKKDVIDLLTRADGGDGVRIFIGSENKLFSLSGSSMIAAPFHDRDQRIVGVLGVIGPTRLNYARIVPMVDFTSKAVARLLQTRSP
jgi:heat-inducible transcriptional repressor